MELNRLMSLPMLYRFNLELSDVDRGVYETLDFRVAQHPSENSQYLLSRTLAFALSYELGLEFSPAGLGDPEAPALKSMGLNGSTDLWIEIGNPSARKLHKATKAAARVQVYTYKNPDVLKEEIKTGQVHRADEIQIFGLDSKFLMQLEERLSKSNRWTILHQQGHLDIGTGGEQNMSTEIRCI